MASAPLRLFPAIPADKPPKSFIKKPRKTSAKKGLHDVQSIALEVKADSTLHPQTKPASEAITHSLFCDPSPEILASISKDTSTPSLASTADAETHASPRRPETRFRRRSSGAHNSPLTGSEISLNSDDETTSRTSRPASNHPSQVKSQTSYRRAKRTQVPEKILTNSRFQPHTSPLTDDDQLSPLPQKQHFTPRPSFSSASPSPKATRSPSPVPSKSRSPLSGFASNSHNSRGPPMRSMFPQYDHSKSLSQQQYYSRGPAQTPPTVSIEKVSRFGDLSKDRTLKHHDSAVGLVDGYEHIPAAGAIDLQDIWDASCEELAVAGRKVQLNLHQFSAKGTALAIGRSSEELIYTMDKIDRQFSQDCRPCSKEMSVKKHHPTQSSSLPVALLQLPDRSLAHTTGRPLTSIFPQSAAVDAIESLITTKKAKEIEELHETLRSPTAAKFAQDAVSAAEGRHRCDLVRKLRRRDSLSSVTAAYDLRHPSLGTFVVNVTKSYSPTTPTVPRAKISLHHPSATPTAIAAETLNLAYLDFARDACVLDLPGLSALDDHYIVDTVVTALLAVAVIENDSLVADSLVFDAPPKTAIPSGGKKSKVCVIDHGTTGEKKFLGRKGGKGKKKRKNANQQDELPMVTQGALALLGFSFKAAVFLLGAGVKVTAGVIVGASNAAKKL